MTPEQIIQQYGPREAMEYDVVIVGAGPAGLSAAIRIKQRAAEKGQDVSVVVLEKGSEPGAHILSGAVMDPKALTELIPDWKEKGAPLHQPVTDDAYVFLSESGGARVPGAFLPPFANNHGNYIVSLGNVVRWLAEQAEGLGVEIFPGFAAAEVLYNEDGSVRGVATGNMGIGKDGEPTENFQLGMELLAKYTLFAEGSRGHLGKQLIARYRLDAQSDPQSYAIGIKELWEIDPSRHTPGFVMHTAGWPMDEQTYGGAFLYHAEDNKVYCGYVVGLNYRNPHLSPFEEFQRWKTHPRVKWYFTDDSGKVNAKRLSYGARAITAGGVLALPKTIFPGGALVGCDAGYLNVSRIKGSHAAIKTGSLAGQAAADAVLAQLQELVQEGPDGGHADERLRAVRAARPRAVDAAPPRAGPRAAAGRRRVSAHRLPQARWPADLRPPVQRVHQQHQPRGKPARAPDAQGPERAGQCQPGPVRRPRGPLLPGRGVRVRARRGQRRQRPAPADQRAELRALQDLRHQGPDAEHRLGHARGWRRPELFGHVKTIAAGARQ